MADEPARLKFSAAQVELLREVLADASPAVIETGERMVRGEVVQRPDASLWIGERAEIDRGRPGGAGERSGRGWQVWMRVRASSAGPPVADTYYVDVVRVGTKLRWLLDKSTELQLRTHPARCWE